VRRALILVLLGLVLGGGAAVTWQAMGKLIGSDAGELEPEMRSSGRMQLLEELVPCKGASRCPTR
jgi:hypothetical protein